MKQRLYKYGIGLSIIMLLLLIPVISRHFSRTSDDIAKSSAIKESAQIAESIKSFRYLYSSKVVDEVNNVSEIQVTHDYENPKYDTIGGAIPLPATLSMELAERMSSEEIKVNLYSKYPFPRRKGRVISEFEDRAWEHFTSNPDTDEPYIQYNSETNQLYYSIPDKMVHKSCVSCHNSHPETPKNDWKLGDVRGVISIVKPVRDEVIFESAIMKTYLLLGGVFFAGLLISLFTFGNNNIVKTELNRRKDKLEKTVEELQLANERGSTALNELRQTQSQLVQSEKMASIGQLTAGVAHELNNPINFVSAGATGLKRDVEDLIKLLEKYEQLDSGESKEDVLQEIHQFKKDTDYAYLKSNVLTSIEDIGMGARRTAEIVKGLSSFSCLQIFMRDWKTPLPSSIHY